MNIISKPLWALFAVLMLICLANPAMASDKIDVTVLNLESAQVDVAALASLTAVLRDEAAQHKQYKISQTPPISISELAIILGCDQTEIDCLKQVADYFETQVLIFGTTAHQDDVHNVKVEIFDAKSARVIHSFKRDFDSNQNLAISFRREISSFFANPRSVPTSRLSITSNVTGADVRLDGVLVGNTPFERLGLPPGSYRVEIAASGFETWSKTITLTDSGEANLKVPLVAVHGLAQSPNAITRPSDQTNASVNWGAWSAISVGTVALGVSGAMAWLMNDTEQEIARRMDVDLTQSQHQRLIDQGNSYQLSHMVLLGVGAVGVTSGVIWLLVDGLSNSNDDVATATKPVQFHVSPSAISATWNW